MSSSFQPDPGFLQQAVELAMEAVDSGSGGPFGAVVVQGDQVVGRGRNCVLLRNDPTAHAEVEALRDAGQHLGRFHLTGCVLYTSCEPCPMCLAAALWARVEAVVYSGTREDAARAGFDDHLFHAVLAGEEGSPLPLIAADRGTAAPAFQRWLDRQGRTRY